MGILIDQPMRKGGQRLAPLLNLTRRLYGYGYTRDQIGPLLRLVDGSSDYCFA